MFALIPSGEDAQRLAVPGGEPIEDLHCTIIYFGEDVSDIDPSEIIQALEGVTRGYGQFPSRAFAWALFNPDGDSACAVYLIGDNSDLAPFRQESLAAVEHLIDLHPQHEPFHAHITAQYEPTFDGMAEVGKVLFDRAELHWAGQTYTFHL